MGQLGLVRLLLVSPCAILCAPQLLGQSISDTLENGVDEVVESVLENGTRDVEDSQFAEMLLQLSMTPIDLNSASFSDLLQVPGIDQLLASRIVSYRSEHGFNSVDELSLVEGVDRALLLQTRGFFIVTTNSSRERERKAWSVHYTERTISRLQDQRGFVDGTYVGNTYKIYNRINTNYALDSKFMIEAGGLTEKDPGEKDITDFSSGYLSLSNAEKSLRFIVGDYVVEAGQGLALWRSSGATKGSEVIATVTKNPRGLQPYTSSDENGFLRGGAMQVRWAPVELTLFISRKSVNANLDDQGCISSFDASGLSRTESEKRTKVSSGERLMGINADAWLFKGFRMGARAYTDGFDNEVALSGINGFHGQNTSLESLDFSYASGTVGSFAELAIDHVKSTAAIGGIVLEPVPALDIALVLHSYPQRFVSLHGFGFGGSGSGLQNEKGVYASARLSVFSWLTVSTYFDQFATIGASAMSLLPTNGSEFLNVIQLQTSEQSSFQFQVKQKNQADEESLSDEFTRSNAVIGRKTQTNFRASFEWSPSSVIRWKTRIENVRVGYSRAGNVVTGYMVYQDVRLRPRTRLSIDGRVVVFDTDSYDPRIYEFESELHGTFVNPALSGKGIRMYVLTRYEIGACEFSIKYSSTIKPGMKSLGTGTNEIQGDIDDQLSFQIDVNI
jgi:hypothetical protein